ncbi:MAG: hypothetical protein ACK5RG_17620 [Cyclobacteriaceae bacterium]|nr:hypothetical protein [Flammeovirgaceae bacterium]
MGHGRDQARVNETNEWRPPGYCFNPAKRGISASIPCPLTPAHAAFRHYHSKRCNFVQIIEMQKAHRYF